MHTVCLVADKAPLYCCCKVHSLFGLLHFPCMKLLLVNNGSMLVHAARCVHIVYVECSVNSVLCAV